MKKLISFLSLSLFCLQGLAEYDDGVARTKVLICENGALEVYAEDGQYNRHLIVVRDQNIWKYVLESSTIAELPECSSLTHPDFANGKICLDNGTEAIIPSFSDWSHHTVGLRWVNSQDGFMGANSARYFEYTVFRDRELIRFELMSTWELHIDDNEYDHEEPYASKFVKAPKILVRDWVFHNCQGF